MNVKIVFYFFFNWHKCHRKMSITQHMLSGNVNIVVKMSKKKMVKLYLSSSHNHFMFILRFSANSLYY